MNEGTKAAGIKDMADALGLSLGTIDRALHGRPGVSEATKARVLAMAEQLGYRPNLAARALKLNRRLTIAVILPSHISQFFDPVRAGIRAAAAATVGMQVALEFHEYPRLGIGDVEAVEMALHRHFDGVIFVPGDNARFDPLIRQITRSGTSMLCVGSDAPQSERAGAVTVHASISGAVAAELLALRLQHPANVAVITGELVTLDHAEKLRGFAATLAALAPHLRLVPPLETHEQPEEAYRQTLQLMQSSHPPQGMYVSTANSLPVLQALAELETARTPDLDKVQVVTTDLFDTLVPHLQAGRVMATLYQRPYTQGKLAFDTLVALLTRRGNPQPVIRLAPSVIFRSNLSLFLRQVHNEESLEGELVHG